MRIMAVAEAAIAQELNALLQDACNGDTFQAGLVPAAAKPGTTPTHYWATWPEHQFGFLAAARQAGKVTDTQITARTDRTTATFNGLMVFRFDDTLNHERVLAKLRRKRSDVPYIPPERDNTPVDEVVASPER
jgi:hypothetical protein